VFVGAVAADSKEPDAAKAFITYLKTPEAAAAFKAKGVKPGRGVAVRKLPIVPTEAADLSEPAANFHVLTDT
jgi:ABC-type glycerol-3-phosphate transport system substrate-binding protein